jgi:F-type H+-transporting ATPase subunit alpha
VSVEKQTMIIYAANSGYLDDVPLGKVAEWETRFYRFMDTTHPEIGEQIVARSVQGKEKMSAELLQQLGAAIAEYRQTAAPEQA